MWVRFKVGKLDRCACVAAIRAQCRRNDGRKLLMAHEMQFVGDLHEPIPCPEEVGCIPLDCAALESFARDSLMAQEPGPEAG